MFHTVLDTWATKRITEILSEVVAELSSHLSPEECLAKATALFSSMSPDEQVLMLQSECARLMALEPAPGWVSMGGYPV